MNRRKILVEFDRFVFCYSLPWRQLIAYVFALRQPLRQFLLFCVEHIYLNNDVFFLFRGEEKKKEKRGTR